ncbi:MAG: NAD-dependent deacylase [Bacteroidia bacterium]|nr:NAD-dependent deacylase [Bacteroidia bacterium]
MKQIVVLTGAGMSAESGIRTFRDSNGLWEEYDVMEVASIEGWRKNPELMLRFYNERRKQMYECLPNKGHLLLAEMEKDFDVKIVTQNVDNLHERAGSTHIIHLHGELSKARSSVDPNHIYDIGDKAINPGDKCEKGSQLRPHIVWFGEEVPAMEEAVKIVESADILCIIGTSLNVYPAAGLLHYAPYGCPIYLIDPNPPFDLPKRVQVIAKGAGAGVEELVKRVKQV